MPQPTAKFQLRPYQGQSVVFLVQLDSRQVPVDRQRAVFAHRNAAKAQVICDALNNGLQLQITIAVITATRRETGAR